LIEGVHLQDQAITESMGPISDHAFEHLKPSDLMITRTRRRLLMAARALRDKSILPSGVEKGGGFSRGAADSLSAATQAPGRRSMPENSLHRCGPCQLRLVPMARTPGINTIADAVVDPAATAPRITRFYLEGIRSTKELGSAMRVYDDGDADVGLIKSKASAPPGLSSPVFKRIGWSLAAPVRPASPDEATVDVFQNRNWTKRDGDGRSC
jgi:hypothetical protein